MAGCVSIAQEHIRASVSVGGKEVAKTPFIKGFNVTKSRAQFSNSFNVTFDMYANSSFGTGGMLSISAGTRQSQRTIFTGLIETVTTQPTLGRPSYFTITLAGRGVLSQLEGTKFTRRLPSDGEGLFCLITGGAANRPNSWYNLDKKAYTGNHTVLSDSPNPGRADGEHSPFIKTPSTFGSEATGSRLAELAKDPTGGGTGGGDFRDHTHERVGEGGPAFAVYSAD